MHIRSLKAHLAAIDTEIAELVRQTPALAHKTRLMQSVVGVGPVTATALLAYLPELGNLTRGEAARLAGLAPINNDSGKTSASRPTQPGRDGFAAPSIWPPASPCEKTPTSPSSPHT